MKIETYLINGMMASFLLSNVVDQVHCHEGIHSRNEANFKQENASSAFRNKIAFYENGGTEKKVDPYQKEMNSKQENASSFLSEKITLFENRVIKRIEPFVKNLNNAKENLELNECAIQLLLNIVDMTYDLFLMYGLEIKQGNYVLNSQATTFLQDIVFGLNNTAKDVLRGILIRDQVLRDRFEREQNDVREGICNPTHRDSILMFINLALNSDEIDLSDVDDL
jgi:hypothetical protein